MRAPLLLAAALAAVVSAPARAASTDASAALTAHNRVVVERFAELFYDRHEVRKAFETYVSPDYIQHSPDIADGREAAIAVLDPMFHRPGFRVRRRPAIVDGDMAVILVHADAQGPTGGAVADIFRLSGGKIVEHWDVNQIVPAKAANAHPLF